jgi:hypothetical protein
MFPPSTEDAHVSARPYKTDPLIELEVMLFGGIPESPRPVYERDVLAYDDYRYARDLFEGHAPTEADEVAIDFGVVQLDEVSGRVIITEGETGV